METEALTAAGQLGAAGLIGWMWLTERRSARTREDQIEAAHRAVLEQRERVGVLIAALEANTRAITALEVGQRELAGLIATRRQGRAAPASIPEGRLRP